MDFSIPDYAFDGATYSPTFDYERLAGQNRRVFDCMKDENFRTLREIEVEILSRDPQAQISQASISARLRDLRKEKFGRHTVERRARGERRRGLWEYRLLVNGGSYAPEN
jgi:hypothetical protein